MSPLLRHPEIDALMRPLLDRGRAALRARFDTVPLLLRPIGGESIAVVTEADFCTAPALVLSYVVMTRSATHVLCASGHLCALIEYLPEKW